MHLPRLWGLYYFSLFYLAFVLDGLANMAMAQGIENALRTVDLSSISRFQSSPEPYSSWAESSPLASAISATGQEFFIPFRANVRDHLPGDIVFRLPSNLHLLEADKEYQLENVSFQIVPFLRGGGLMVNLSLCSAISQVTDCTIGHFSTLPRVSQTAQNDLVAHQSIGYPITLAPDIQAYFREYRDGPINYASLMWVQDDQFYQVQFPVIERRNMLYMALEMVNSTPITASNSSRSLVDSNGLSMIQIEGEEQENQPVDSSNDPVDWDSLTLGSSRLFSEQELNYLLAQIQATEPTITLGNLADQITQEYLNRGYITSRALPEGDSDLVFKEGFLSRIIVEGNQSVDEGYIKARLDLVGGPPLNLDRLEEKLRLLRIDPLFSNVEATLRQAEDGEEREGGGIDLIVRVTEANPWIYGASINNDSAPSIGAEQFALRIDHLNLSGVGDRLSASYSHSFAGGLSYVDLGYQVPLSPTDTTLRFSGAFISTTVVEAPFNELNVQGDTSRYGVWLRQPLIRRPQEELALSLGFTHTAGQTFLFDRLPTPFGFGPDPDGFSRTSVISFAQDYVFREPDGAWAFTSQFNVGTGLLEATQNSAPVPDGQFFSWQGLAQRVQRIGLDHLLVASFNVQLTPDPLLPSESFTIGGPNSVRGYRQGARSGDNGLRFSLEDRITVHRDGAGRPVLILSPFLDLGSVWNHPNNPNTIPNQSFLMGSGLGLLMQNIEGLNGFSFRLNYGFPIVNLQDRGNNLQDSGFYFGIDYNSAPNQ